MKSLGIVYLCLGIALIAADNPAGWVFFILGLVWAMSDDDE